MKNVNKFEVGSKFWGSSWWRCRWYHYDWAVVNWWVSNSENVSDSELVGIGSRRDAGSSSAGNQLWSFDATFFSYIFYVKQGSLPSRDTKSDTISQICDEKRWQIRGGIQILSISEAHDEDADRITHYDWAVVVNWWVSVRHLMYTAVQ